MKAKKPRAYLQVIVGSLLGVGLGFGVHQFFVGGFPESEKKVFASVFTENQCRACREFTGCADCERDQAYCASLAYQEPTPELQDAAILECNATHEECRLTNECEAICGFFCNGQPCSEAGGYCTSDTLCCSGSGLTCVISSGESAGTCQVPCANMDESCATKACCSANPPVVCNSLSQTCTLCHTETASCGTKADCCGDLDCVNGSCTPPDPCSQQEADGMPQCDTDDQGNAIPPYFPPSGPGEVCDTVRKCYERAGTICNELSATSFCEDTPCGVDQLCEFPPSSSSSSSSQPMCCNLVTEQCEPI